jgi:SNF family Na+-dependent transporter
MIEQWNNETFYQNYFNQCQPDECSATYVNRGNILYIITTMTGLIGGLTKVYLFAVPLLVKIFFLLIIRFKRRKLISNRVAPLDTTTREN